MASLHVGASLATPVATATPPSLRGSIADRSSRALASDVGVSTAGGAALAGGMSSNATSPLLRSEDSDTTFGKSRTSAAAQSSAFSWSPPMPLSSDRGLSARTARRREMRNSHPPVGMFGYPSDAASVESLGRAAGAQTGGGRVSGMKRRRSSLASAKVAKSDHVRSGAAPETGFTSPGSWGSSEARAIGDGGLQSGTLDAFVGFRRNQMGDAGRLVGQRELSEDDEEMGEMWKAPYGHSNSGGQGARHSLEFENGFDGKELDAEGAEGRGKPLTDMEAYGSLLNRVERLEDAVRAFLRESAEERRELRRMVENGQLEQSALERRHGAFKDELDENHLRWAHTERYLDVMRREMSKAIGARESTALMVVKSTVINTFYYVMAYLVVPVFAFVIRGLRDGYVWTRRKVRGRRKDEEEGE